MTGDELRGCIDTAGGLHSQADIARMLDVSRPRALELTRLPDFPAPVVTVGRSAMWAGNDVHAWRAGR